MGGGFDPSAQVGLGPRTGIAAALSPMELSADFRNNDFTDKTADVRLSQKVFNTQAAAWADLNKKGRLDLILANAAQESVVLFGRKEN